MKRLGASFRDPNGFVYKKNGKLYRQVNPRYRRHYDFLISSGLFEDLVKDNLMVGHKEISFKASNQQDPAYKVLEPMELPFISYPYEWSFSQLKDAALLTLRIQKRALDYGMILKDASAYNIQFYEGKPIFIDTLSFEKYTEGMPWIAYRQYCQHFLSPLALMSFTDVRLSQLLRVYIDGIPLDLASRLLPRKTRLKPAIAAHIHLHARMQKKHSSDPSNNSKKATLSKQSLINLLSSLEVTTSKLTWQPKGTEWGEYYTFTNYSEAALKHKEQIIRKYIEKIKPKDVWDFGANTGLFSRIASDMGVQTVAFDIDTVAVEKNYRQVKEKKEKNMLPLVSDLTNPSPAIGWSHLERNKLLDRGPADLGMALALVHHLAISNNVPLESVAAFFHKATKYLIIEFAPKSDSKVRHLLSSREDIFTDYNQAGFETAFKKHFNILQKNGIKGSKRTLYLMKRN